MTREKKREFSEKVFRLRRHDHDDDYVALVLERSVVGHESGLNLAWPWVPDCLRKDT